MNTPKHLLDAYFMETITPEEFEELKAWLKADRNHLAILMRESALHEGLHHILSGEELYREDGLQEPHLDLASEEALAENTEKQAEIEAYARQQLQAYMAEQERLNLAQARQGRQHRQDRDEILTHGWRLAKRVMIAAAAVVIIGLSILGVVESWHNRVLASLQETADANWAVEPESMELRRGNLVLEQGFATLMFTNGTEVIVEGPSSFTLEKPDQLILHKGKVAAKVIEQGKGFTVRTPGASVVDLGTEFGVWVNNRTGDSEAHVFKGEVEVQGHGKGAPQVLNGHEACIIDDEGDFVERKTIANPSLFIRHIPSPYEVAILKTSPELCSRLDRDFPDQLFNILANRYALPIEFHGQVSTVSGPNLPGLGDHLMVHLDDKPSYAVVHGIETNPLKKTGIGYTTMLWMRPDILGKQMVMQFSRTIPLKSKMDVGRFLCLDETGRLVYWHRKSRGQEHQSSTVHSQTRMQVGQWYHVTVMRNMDGPERKRRIFINGVLEDAKDCDVPLPHDLWSVYIGGDNPQSKPSGCVGFQGAVSLPVYYNRALSDKEVESIYRSASLKQ